MSRKVTSDYIWWDGRYLSKGEPWGTVRHVVVEASISGPDLWGWSAALYIHGQRPTFSAHDTEAEAQAAVEQWVREQGEK